MGFRRQVISLPNWAYFFLLASTFFSAFLTWLWGFGPPTHWHISLRSYKTSKCFSKWIVHLLQQAKTHQMKRNKNKQGILPRNPMTWVWIGSRCRALYQKVDFIYNHLRKNVFSDPCDQTLEDFFWLLAWEDIARHSETAWQGLAQWLATMSVVQKALTSLQPPNRPLSLIILHLRKVP